MAPIRERLSVEYDDGYFDKDEQGWCSNHHRLRVEGDVVHVERWGDSAGRAAFSETWDARIVELDAPNELAVLARGESQLLFDLRAQRLLGSFVQVRERVALAAPPCFETAERFSRWALSMLERVRGPGGGEVGARIRDDGEQMSARRRTLTLLRGDLEVGLAHLIYAPPATLLRVDVSCGAHRVLASWHGSEPLVASLHGGADAGDLRPLRALARAEIAPMLWRPSLALRALLREAQEVGSMLSYVDHGGGADAWARIERAGASGRALVALLAEPLAEAGALEVARGFADAPTSRWLAIDALAKTEVALRPTGPRERFVDACGLVHLLGRAEDATADEVERLRLAIACLAAAAVAGQPSEGSSALRQALVGARDGIAGARTTLEEALRHEPAFV